MEVAEEGWNLAGSTPVSGNRSRKKSRAALLWMEELSSDDELFYANDLVSDDEEDSSDTSEFTCY